MRFSFAEGMTHAEYYAPLARAAETAGYTSMTIADSLIYPRESDSKYPYTDTGDREFLEGKEFIETMILCAHLFAVTTTLRLTPFVLKLPIRPPVLVAKQASSLAFLSGNRLGLDGFAAERVRHEDTAAARESDAVAAMADVIDHKPFSHGGLRGKIRCCRRRRQWTKGIPRYHGIRARWRTLKYRRRPPDAPPRRVRFPS